MLILDAGNLLFKKEALSPGTPTEIAKITAEIIVTAFNDIGCHAFSPGSKDFAAGLDFVQEMQLKANFPFISANIQDINGNRLFDPYLIIDVEGLSVGIIGLASNFNHSDIYVQDPIDALSELVGEVNNQSDVLVLMFDSDEADIIKLQTAGFPIDLIIRSKAKTRSQDGGERNIPAYSCGDRGKYLYQFDLTMTDPNTQFIDLAIYENKSSRAEKKLNKIGFEWTYYSECEDLENCRVVIVDVVGILADLYAYSDIAYVGAGFGAGVHSVLEPAVYSNLIGFGPNYQIVDMAVSLKDKELAQVIQSGKEFAGFLSILDRKSELDDLQGKMQQFITEQKPAAENILKEIFRGD